MALGRRQTFELSFQTQRVCFFSAKRTGREGKVRGGDRDRRDQKGRERKKERDRDSERKREESKRGHEALIPTPSPPCSGPRQAP